MNNCLQTKAKHNPTFGTKIATISNELEEAFFNNPEVIESNKGNIENSIQYLQDVHDAYKLGGCTQNELIAIRAKYIQAIFDIKKKNPDAIILQNYSIGNKRVLH